MADLIPDDPARRKLQRTTRLSSATTLLEQWTECPLDAIRPPAEGMPDLEQLEKDAAFENAESTMIEVMRCLTNLSDTLQIPIPKGKAFDGLTAQLREIPADLLNLANDRLIKSYTWEKFPKPGDWYKAIDGELKERRKQKKLIWHVGGRIKVARLHYPQNWVQEEPAPPVTEESKARVAAIVAQLKTPGSKR
jgi:hypothetical protein